MRNNEAVSISHRLIGLALLAAGMAGAAPAAPAAGDATSPAVETVQAEAPAEPLLRHELRDPFWPVGYSPAARVVPAAVATTEAVPETVAAPIADDLMKRALALLRVGGIIRRGTKCFATVNGMMLEAGDTFPIWVDDSVVIFRVRSVDLKSIRIEPVKK